MINFSHTYYKKLNLTAYQHQKNNDWFKKQIDNLKVSGKQLYIPELNTYFDKNGEPVKYDYIVGGLFFQNVS